MGSVSDLLVTWWASMGGLQSSLLEGLGTVAAALVGAWAISWQIGRQARHAIEQNRLNERLKLRLDVYREIEALCVRATHAEVALTGTARSAMLQLRNYRSAVSMTGRPAPPRARIEPLIPLQEDATGTVVGLIQAVEKWRIVDVRLGVFQTAFNVAQHDFLEAWQSYFRSALMLLPMDPPAGATGLIWDPPEEEAIAEFALHFDALECAGGQLQAWVVDLRRELQLAMLGELFEGGDLPVRRPLDPRYFAITLAGHKEAERLLLDTPWGQAHAEATARVKAQANPS
jgi:hypothetical protein